MKVRIICTYETLGTKTNTKLINVNLLKILITPFIVATQTLLNIIYIIINDNAKVGVGDEFK